MHDGQPVEIKVETVSFTRYGLLHGSVVSINRDSTATTNEQSRQQSPRDRPSETDDKTTQSRQPSYIALVSLDRAWIDTEQGRRELGLGMAVTAEIKTGRRRLISYLLSPPTRYRQEAGRER